MTDVLVLNKDAQPLSMLPVSVIPWQTAIRLCFLEKVRPLEYYPDWVVRSPSTTLRVPSVVITTDYIKWNRIVKYNRQNIYLRDNYTCQLCGEKPGLAALTLDHVVPRSKGGKSNWTNMVTCCKRCNEKKGDNEAIVPKKMPVKPSYYEMVGKRQRLPLRVRDQSWLDYIIGWPEDTIEICPPKGNP